MPPFGVSAISPKKPRPFNTFSTSAIAFITCWNCHHMKNNTRYKGIINNTSVIIFFNRHLTIPALSFFPWPGLLFRRPSYTKKSKTSNVIVMVGICSCIYPSFMVGVPNWGHITGKVLLDICCIVKVVHIPWKDGWEHLDDDEKKPLSGLGPISGPNYYEGKAVYISESGLYRAPFRIFYVILRGWSTVPPLFQDNF